MRLKRFQVLAALLIACRDPRNPFFRSLLELLGLEQGMFEHKHKHLHAKANPLDGNRDEIVGRLGVLLDQLSDRDLESIGLRRITVVEAV